MHSPGPWHRNIKPATKYPTVWAGRNKHVAYVATSGLSEEEVEANIALITQAPDLLQAAHVAYACLRRPYAERDENKVVNILLNAIAKATPTEKGGL